MFIKCYDIQKSETVWLNAENVCVVHRFDDDHWPILETSNGDKFEVDDEDEVKKVADLVGKDKPVPTWATIPLEELELSVRSFNILKRAGVRNVQDILDRGSDEIMHLRNMGRKSYFEITEKLRERGAWL